MKSLEVEILKWSKFCLACWQFHIKSYFQKSATSGWVWPTNPKTANMVTYLSGAPSDCFWSFERALRGTQSPPPQTSPRPPRWWSTTSDDISYVYLMKIISPCPPWSLSTASACLLCHCGWDILPVERVWGWQETRLWEGFAPVREKARRWAG